MDTSQKFFHILLLFLYGTMAMASSVSQSTHWPGLLSALAQPYGYVAQPLPLPFPEARQRLLFEAQAANGNRLLYTAQAAQKAIQVVLVDLQDDQQTQLEGRLEAISLNLNRTLNSLNHSAHSQVLAGPGEIVFEIKFQTETAALLEVLQQVLPMLWQ